MCIAYLWDIMCTQIFNLELSESLKLENNSGNDLIRIKGDWDYLLLVYTMSDVATIYGVLS